VLRSRAINTNRPFHSLLQRSIIFVATPYPPHLFGGVITGTKPPAGFPKFPVQTIQNDDIEPVITPPKYIVGVPFATKILLLWSRGIQSPPYNLHPVIWKYAPILRIFAAAPPLVFLTRKISIPLIFRYIPARRYLSEDATLLSSFFSPASISRCLPITIIPK
jgi:hypothetical protein